MNTETITSPSLIEKEPSLLIGLSTDQLAIIKKEKPECKEDIDFLLKGIDSGMFILEGPSETIYELIDDCYNARATNTAINVECNNGEIITFK